MLLHSPKALVCCTPHPRKQCKEINIDDDKKQRTVKFGFTGLGWKAWRLGGSSSHALVGLSQSYLCISILHGCTSAWDLKHQPDVRFSAATSSREVELILVLL